MAADEPGKGSPHDRARVVRRYLSALDARKPGRTTARTAESVVHRMHQVDTLLMSADPVQRLLLTQERIDLHAEQLRLATSNGDFAQLEKAFTRVARAWGDRHDITYSAWRQVGVDTEVLTKAGITPAPKPARPQAPAAAVKADTTDVKSDVPQTPPDPSKTEPKVKKRAAAKKTPAGKQTAPTKKAAAAKLDATTPEQQRLPAEAHLLS